MTSESAVDFTGYLSGPVLHRQTSDRSGRWLWVLEAEHDGTGWLVQRVRRSPCKLIPGRKIHVECEVVEDHGDTVVVAIGGRHGSWSRSIDTDLVRFVEEPSDGPEES